MPGVQNTGLIVRVPMIDNDNTLDNFYLTTRHSNAQGVYKYLILTQ